LDRTRHGLKKRKALRQERLLVLRCLDDSGANLRKWALKIVHENCGPVQSLAAGADE
jgi:hypothetical protein